MKQFNKTETALVEHVYGTLVWNWGDYTERTGLIFKIVPNDSQHEYLEKYYAP